MENSILLKLSLICTIVGVFIFSVPSGAEKSRKKVTLSWETPQEGSAVNFNSEKDYMSAVPVLQSTGASPKILQVQLDMAPEVPKLQRVILPGSENEPDDTSAEEILDNKLAYQAAQKAIDFYENKITTVKIQEQAYNIATDCSFFVRAAYWEGSNHTRDLFMESISSNAIDPNKATGVTLLAFYFEKNHRYQPRNPKVGDIIIFDNTYDKNNNQKRDDYYTHTGIVTKIRDDETIEFIHGNIGRTIQRGYINFHHKNAFRLNDKPVNSYIRPKYSWEKSPNENLSSYLVRAFGGY